MDRNFYDNDFEEFLKQKSDQYKMYPSDRVWNNIYTSLHGRKKWWVLGFTLFFITTGLLVGRQVLLSDYNEVIAQLNKGTETVFIAKRTVPTTSSTSTTQNNRIVSSGTTTANTVLPGGPVTTAGNFRNNNNTASGTPASAGIPQSGKINNTGSIKNNDVVSETTETATSIEGNQVIENNLIPELPVIRNNEGLNTAVSIPAQQPAVSPVAKKTGTVEENKETQVINQLEQKATQPIKYSNWSLLFYASPTISYRRLTTLNQKGDSYVPVAANSGNINNYVHHLPATGFELGTNVQYKLSGSLTVFGGAQLNYSRYYIDAFKYRTEKASIALANDQLHDTLSGYTNIRNFSGYAPEQLQNKYLQLSLPVGIEIKLLGNKKLQFNIAGGVQPTFLLTSNSYLISSDYKNYIQSPDLVRGFNVHTNFEAFISYQTGGLKWQVGPQFRSQLLSSYTNQYRVREYLTEYGIKFGVSRSF